MSGAETAAGAAWIRRLSAGVALAALGRAGAVLAMAVFAAHLALDDWGAFAHARGVLTVAAPLMTLGLSVSVVRRAPQYAAAGRGADAAGHVALGFALSAAWAVPAGLAAWAWPGPAGGLIAAAPAAGGLFFGAQAARAQDRPALAYAPPGLGALAGAGAFAASGAQTAGVAAACLALGLWTAALAQAAGVLRGAERPRLTAARVWLAEGAPLILSLAARGLALLGPFLLLPVWAGEVEAGVYGLAWLGAQAALTAVAGAGGAAAPRLSAAVGRGDPPAARRAAGMAAGAGAGSALAVAGLPALGLAMAPEAAEALRPGLSAAAGPLGLLAIAAALQALDGPLGVALVAQGRGRDELAAQFMGTGAALAAAATLIPPFGATGAAAAVAAGAGARLAASLARRPFSPAQA